MSASSQSVGRGLAYIFIAATAWGTGGAAAAFLYRDSGLGPVAVSFWRLVGGVALLAVFQLLRRRPDAPRPRLRPTQLLVTGVGLVVYQTAYFASVRYAGLAVATIVTLAAGPVLMAVGSRLLLGERLGRLGTATVGLALVGLVLLVGGGGGATASAPVLGLAMAFLSAIGYAGVTLLTRQLGHRGVAGDPYATALGGFSVGVVCLLPLALWEGIWPTSEQVGRTVGLLAYLGAVPTALAYALFFVGLATVRATTASVIALVEPLTATVIAVTLLGERLTVTTTIGAAVLLAAVVTLTLSERRAAGSAAPVEPVVTRTG